MILYQKENNDRIKCLACNHYCSIAPGNTGVCGVRQNVSGELKLLVYGRPCAVHVDPIEKKPLYHFLPGSKIFSLGTYGCNFKCGFCQNWDISQVKSKNEKVKSVIDELDFWSSERVVDEAIRSGCQSVAYTYNEPTIWTEYAGDIAKLAKKEGLKNVYVSNGYLSKECCEYVAPWLDAINIDLKSFSNEFYSFVCRAKLAPVLETIKRLHKQGVWVEVTTLIIPKQNDSLDELKKCAEFIASVSKDIPWHLSAFHGDYKMANHPATDLDSLLKTKDIGQRAGLKYVYVGNVESGKYNNTYCPACGELLIERGYMEVIKNYLTNSQCYKCGGKIVGIF